MDWLYYPGLISAISIDSAFKDIVKKKKKVYKEKGKEEIYIFFFWILYGNYGNQLS